MPCQRNVPVALPGYGDFDAQTASVLIWMSLKCTTRCRPASGFLTAFFPLIAVHLGAEHAAHVAKAAAALCRCWDMHGKLLAPELSGPASVRV